MRTMISLGLLLALSTPAVAKDNTAKLMALTREQFASKMEVRDDPLDTFVVFSTERGYRKMTSTGGFLLGTQSDIWLKAVVDRRTQVVTYVVVAQASWVGGVQVFRQASYSAPDGAHDVAVEDMRSDEIGPCLSVGCSFDAELGAVVDERTLRAAAEASEPWRFRFRSNNGIEFENAIAPTEVQALLDAVAAHKAKHPV